MPELTFTGLVTAVESRSLLAFESIDVADQSGSVTKFNSGGQRFEEFTPSHVREHMLAGDLVEVTYRKSGDDLIIVSLRDVPSWPPVPSVSP